MAELGLVGCLAGGMSLGTGFCKAYLRVRVLVAGEALHMEQQLVLAAFEQP